MSEQEKQCSSRCEFFRCGQRSLVFQGSRTWCRWAEDECSAASCSYAMCVRGRILPNGLCGLTVRRRTAELEGPEEMAEEIKLRGKISKRIGRYDLL